jgi:hypothetical protein
MAKELSFVPADKNKLTIAETWLERIDRPWVRTKNAHQRTRTGIDRRAAKRMKKAALEDIQDGTSLYFFKDGSCLWEKHQDEWFVLDAENAKRRSPDYK